MHKLIIKNNKKKDIDVLLNLCYIGRRKADEWTIVEWKVDGLLKVTRRKFNVQL